MKDITQENAAAQGDVVKTTLMVAMRDGVRLATDVYLPASGGPFPVLLERTPYGRNEPTRRERTVREPQPLIRGELAARFARHGYAVVVQDCRGRFDSEGR
ncbi:MAG: CocE/NonD family hydrolase, partial [Polaromonas sp.]